MKNRQYRPYFMAESPTFFQEQFLYCGLGYGADTAFHRTYFFLYLNTTNMLYCSSIGFTLLYHILSESSQSPLNVTVL